MLYQYLINPTQVKSRYRAETVSVNFHGANDAILSDVMGMSRQGTFATPQLLVRE